MAMLSLTTMAIIMMLVVVMVTVMVEVTVAVMLLIVHCGNIVFGCVAALLLRLQRALRLEPELGGLAPMA